MSQTHHTAEVEHTVTRRDFFRIATGTLMAMPAVAGGFLVPPSLAYAEDLSEEHGGTADEVSERIVVVSPSEVGFCVVDMADGGTTKVAGARVVVTSRYNGGSVEDTTDPDGIVTFDLKELAENPDNQDVNKLDSYEFNGSILITADGYRTCEMPLVRIEGGQPLIVPTRKLTDGLPYPRSTTLNEWDALYTENAFAQTKDNTGEHVFAIDWRQVSSSEATVSLKRRDTGEVLLTTTATPADGVLTASFTGSFLNPDSPDALPKDTNFDVEVVQDGRTYTNTIQLKVVEGAVAAPAAEENVKLTPINTNSLGSNQTGLDLRWPSGIPLVGGGSLKTWSPDLPVDVYINPFGYIQVTIKTPYWGYKRDNSGSDEQGWGTYPQKSVAQQFNKMLTTAEKMSTATATALGSPKFFGQIDMAASFSLMGNFQLVAAAQWSSEKGTFQGLLGAQLFLACDASITENFFAGPIPVLITFAINAGFTVSINCGIYSVKDPNKPDEKLIEAAFDFSRWKFDYTDTGLTVTLNIVPSLSVGVGIRGVASISVQGKFALMMYFGFTYRGELDTSTHPLPHYIFGYSAQINLVLHMFLFTKTFNLKNWKYRDFYNNWEGGLQSMADEAAGDMLQAMADETMPSLLGQMNIITSDMLSQTVEFDGSTALSAQGDADDAQAETEFFDWETMREDDLQAPLDDGTMITYAVYSLREEDADEATGQAQDAAGEPTAQTQEGASGVAAQAQDANGEATAQALAQDAAGEPTAGGESADAELAVASEDTDLPDADGSAELEAQAAEQQETDAADAAAASVPTREQGRLRRSASVVYTPRGGQGMGAGQADGLTAQAWNFLTLPDPAVKGLGTERGICASSDTVIAEKVFGDPRVKVLNVNLLVGTDSAYATCCFRIASVTVDGVPRTRLVMSILYMQRGDESWAESIPRYRVLDFDINDIDGVSHKDLYDYDFDVALTTHTETYAHGVTDTVDVVVEQLEIAVVSGRRASDDATSLASVATDLVFTYLSFDVEELRWEKNTYQISRSILASDVMGADGRCHCISSLQCVPDADNDSKVAIISYLDRIADTPDDILSDEEGKVDIKPSFVLVNVRNGSMLIPKRADIDAKMGIISDPGIFELSLSPKIGGYFTLGMRGLKRTHFYLLDVDSSNATISSILLGGALDSSMHLVPWPQQDCFLTSYPKADYVETLAANWENPDDLDRSQWVLQKASWNTQTAVPGMATLSFEPIGPESFNFSNFGINTAGSLIFWPQGKSGDDGRVYAEDGSYEANEDRAIYQIMACRIRDGKFGDPFVAADVPHDMASLHIVSTHDTTSPLEVVSNELLAPDGDEVYYASNLWYTSVPNLLCATAIGCECPIPLAGAGHALRFNVTIRNDGNTYLSGCNVVLCVHRDDTVYLTDSEATLTFGEDTLLESHYNPKLEDGSLQGVEADWSLAPGKCSVYAVDVTIPSDWEGEQFVSLIASQPQLAERGGLNAQAEEDGLVYQTYEAAPGEYKVHQQRTSTDQDPDRTHMHVITVVAPVATGDPYSDAPVRMTDDAQPASQPASQPAQNNGGNAGGGAASQRPADTRGERVPHTADPTSPGLVAGLALAGAALVGYGRRRAANESPEEASHE